MENSKKPRTSSCSTCEYRIRAQITDDKEAKKLFNIKFEEARATAEMEVKQKEKEKPLQPKNEGQRQKKRTTGWLDTANYK
ncbi:hypothetical protein TKK_0012427 [Trichogramma kaykai]